MQPSPPDAHTFARNIERHLDDVPAGVLAATTRLCDLPGWTSLQALIVAASFDWDYGVTVSADEFARAETVDHLYALVLGKLSS